MWSRCKVREVHCGHKHKEMLNEYMGTKVRFIPSICANDTWHKSVRLGEHEMSHDDTVLKRTFW